MRLIKNDLQLFIVALMLMVLAIGAVGLFAWKVIPNIESSQSIKQN